MISKESFPAFFFSPSDNCLRRVHPFCVIVNDLWCNHCYFIYQISRATGRRTPTQTLRKRNSEWVLKSQNSTLDNNKSEKSKGTADLINFAPAVFFHPNYAFIMYSAPTKREERRKKATFKDAIEIMRNLDAARAGEAEMLLCIKTKTLL